MPTKTPRHSKVEKDMVPPDPATGAGLNGEPLSASPFRPVERMVFDAIGGANGISRAKIADLTGLGAPMVTMVTRTLIAKGLVWEGDPERGRRGQPARPLLVDPDGGYAFGVTFTPRLITTGLLDLAGNIRAEASEQVEHFSGAVLQRSVRTLVSRLQRRCRIDPKRILGIGINIPATASSQRGHFHTHDYFAELRGIDLAARLGDGLPYPVVLETDPFCAAIGEQMHGIGRSFDSFFQIHIAFRYGGALMLKGEPYRGAHGNAGVIGIVFPVDKPRPSGQDLIEHLAASGLKIADFPDLEAIDPGTCPALDIWLDRPAAQLARSIELVARRLDPEAIVVGGRIPAHLIEALLDRIDLDGVFDYSRHMPVPAVVASKLAGRAGLIGAACSVFHRYLGLTAGTARAAKAQHMS